MTIQVPHLSGKRLAASPAALPMRKAPWLEHLRVHTDIAPSPHRLQAPAPPRYGESTQAAVGSEEQSVILKHWETVV